MRRGIKLRVLMVGAVAAALSVAVLGSAGRSEAATAVNVVLSPLIGTTSNSVQQVTFGGKIGYHLEFTNVGDSAVNHVVAVVDSDTATFSDASRPECAANPQDATQMVCTLQQLSAGATFSVDLRFTAPATGSVVVTTSSVTVAAQTNGSPTNNGTNTFAGTTVTTSLVSAAANALVKTYAKPTETVATNPGLLQHSAFNVPGSLLTGAYGVEMSVEETTGAPLCDKCPGLLTNLSIPATLSSGNPFSPSNPYSFTVSLLPDGMPPGYKPTGLFHDGLPVPMCSTTPLGVGTHMCLNSFSVDKKLGVVAQGIADQNGSLGFG